MFRRYDGREFLFCVSVDNRELAIKLSSRRTSFKIFKKMFAVTSVLLWSLFGYTKRDNASPYPSRKSTSVYEFARCRERFSYGLARLVSNDDERTIATTADLAIRSYFNICRSGKSNRTLAPTNTIRLIECLLRKQFVRENSDRSGVTQKGRTDDVRRRGRGR